MAAVVRRRLDKKHLIAATVVANFVLVTQSLWQPIDDVFAVAAASLASALHDVEPKTLNFSTTAIVKITPARFADAYEGNSPLDRCKLQSDLAQLLTRPTIRTVAVDLDLSPTERPGSRARLCPVPLPPINDDLRSLPPADRDIVCQCHLDALLEKSADRLVLMQPGASTHRATDASITLWHQRLANRVSFGNGELKLTRGIVREHRPLDDSKVISLGDATYRHIQRERAWARDRTATRPVTQWDSNAPADAYPGGIVAAPIAFHALKGLYDAGGELEPSDACFAEDGKECQIHAVLFGAGYSADDKFATPIGTLDGVDVHAAIAACPVPSRARAGLLHVAAYAAEVLLGAVLLGPLFGWYWKRYFDTLAGRLPTARAGPASWWTRTRRLWTPTHPDTAYGWLAWLAVVAVLGLLVLVVGVPVLANSVSPNLCRVPGLSAAFLVGMALEAAVLQGTEAATHAVSPHQAHASLAPCAWCRSLPWLLYAGLFGLALPVLLTPH